jgi:hypothetical protein
MDGVYRRGDPFTCAKLVRGMRGRRSAAGACVAGEAGAAGVRIAADVRDAPSGGGVRWE